MTYFPEDFIPAFSYRHDILDDPHDRSQILRVPTGSPTAHYSEGELTVTFFQHSVDFELIRQALKSTRADGHQVKAVTLWASPEAARESYAGHMLEKLGFDRVLDPSPMLKFVKTLKQRKVKGESQ